MNSGEIISIDLSSDSEPEEQVGVRPAPVAAPAVNLPVGII